MSTKRSGKGAAPGAVRPERYDLRILNAIRQIVRAADLDSRQLAANHKITAPQLMSLMAVVEQTPTTAIAIARRVHLGASTLVGVLDRLEAKGLIVRQRSVEDRREIMVVPTAAGRAVVAKTPFPLQHALDRALAQMSEKQRRQVASSIEQLVANMEVQETDASPMLEIVAVGSRQGKAPPGGR